MGQFLFSFYKSKKEFGGISMTIETKKTTMEEHVAGILELIGEDPYREGLMDTPKRVAKMYREVFEGVGVDPETAFTTTFEEHYEEWLSLNTFIIIHFANII